MLNCRRRGVGNPIAEPCKADAEIRVLRHVPRIPSVNVPENRGAEVVGGSPEGNRTPDVREAGIEHVEQGRVLDGEQPLSKNSHSCEP